jgi:hypothetical protein
LHRLSAAEAENFLSIYKKPFTGRSGPRHVMLPTSNSKFGIVEAGK